MQVPRQVVRFNNAVNNRVQMLWAPYLPPFAVLVHEGRKSGRRRETPVVAAKRGVHLYVAILYGEQSDWLRNILAAGSGEVRRGRRTYSLGHPEVRDAKDVPDSVGRLLGRPSGRVLMAEITPL